LESIINRWRQSSQCPLLEREAAAAAAEAARPKQTKTIPSKYKVKPTLQLHSSFEAEQHAQQERRLTEERAAMDEERAAEVKAPLPV
jgi:hypothetical protein